MKSEEGREVWGNVCGHCGVGVAGGCSCGPDCPQGCPAIRPLRIGFLSIAIHKVSGGKDVPVGGACPAPTDGGIFAAVAGQSGQAMCLRAGWPARVPCNPAPTDKGQFVAITEPGWWGNAPAGRIARKGALQSGPYE